MPSALVAKLRKQPEVRDAEALAAWIGRYQKLRKAGVSNKRAMKLAGKPGGMKEGGVKAEDRKTGGGKSKNTVKLPNGEATYDPKTKTVSVPGPIPQGKGDREATLKAIKSFPDAEKVKIGKANPLSKSAVVTSLENMIAKQGGGKDKPEDKGGDKGGDKDKSNTVKLAGGGEATYDPETKTARIPNDAIGLANRKKSRKNIEAIEKAFPGVERIESESGTGMDIKAVKRSFGMQTEEPKPVGPIVGTPPKRSPAEISRLREEWERRRKEEARKQAEKEAKQGINIRRAQPFYDRSTGNVLLRAEQPREPTDKDRAKIMQEYPEARTFTWNGKEYPLKDAAPPLGEKAPVSRFISVPPGGGKRLDSVRSSLRTIGDVHDVEGLQPISLTTKLEKRGRLGTFSYDMRGRPVKINIASAKRPNTTFAHEVGHYLDMEGVGSKGSYASKDPNSEVAPIMRAIEKTPTVDRLRDMRANPERYEMPQQYMRYDGSVHEYTTKPSTDHLAYMSSPEELFARAYAQYIAGKGKDP